MSMFGLNAPQLSLSLTEPPCINVFSASFPFGGPYLYCINRPKCAGVHDAMSLRCPPASPYGTTSTGIISAAVAAAEGASARTDGFHPFLPIFMEAAASHPSAVCSSIPSRPCSSRSAPPLCFISSAWLKSSKNQSVFLWSVLPTIPSIRLYFELWFSLWMGLFFFFSFFQTDAEKLISWGGAGPTS